jgi:hypothetical protein
VIPDLVLLDGNRRGEQETLERAQGKQEWLCHFGTVFGFFANPCGKGKTGERTTRGMAGRGQRHKTSWKKWKGRGGSAQKDRRKKGVNREKRGCKA